jgi:hypothetical protein
MTELDTGPEMFNDLPGPSRAEHRQAVRDQLALEDDGSVLPSRESYRCTADRDDSADTHRGIPPEPVKIAMLRSTLALAPRGMVDGASVGELLEHIDQLRAELRRRPAPGSAGRRVDRVAAEWRASIAQDKERRLEELAARLREMAANGTDAVGACMHHDRLSNLRQRIEHHLEGRPGSKPLDSLSSLELVNEVERLRLLASRTPMTDEESALRHLRSGGVPMDPESLAAIRDGIGNVPTVMELAPRLLADRDYHAALTSTCLTPAVMAAIERTLHDDGEAAP